MNQKPFINNTFKLQRFPGKGGWTYVAIPDIISAEKTPFGWRKVKGFIDEYAFKNYHLMPMKNGGLFFPVKSQIRKHIGKAQGDTVKIILFDDDTPLEIPYEMLICLKDEPAAYEKFIELAEKNQKEFLDWIYASKREDTKAIRIAGMITMILEGKTLRNK